MKLIKFFIAFKKPGILLLTMLLISYFSRAQKPENEIERFVRDFAQAYQNIPRSRDEETVLKYISKDLKSTILKSNVMANYGLIHSDYKDFEYHLRQMIDTDGMSVKYGIKNIYKSKVEGETGVVVCEINVEVASRGVIWTKGTEITSFVLKKYADGWKIIHFFVIGLEDQQTKGICLLEVYESSLGDFVIKTIIPKDNDYIAKLNTFDFSKDKRPLSIKTNNDITYTWNTDGTVNRLNNEDSSVKAIGKADNKYDVSMLIITEDLYAGSCTEFKVKH